MGLRDPRYLRPEKLVGKVGLEPTRLTARASKTRMAAITSPAQNFIFQKNKDDYTRNLVFVNKNLYIFSNLETRSPMSNFCSFKNPTIAPGPPNAISWSGIKLVI